MFSPLQNLGSFFSLSFSGRQSRPEPGHRRQHERDEGGGEAVPQARPSFRLLRPRRRTAHSVAVLTNHPDVEDREARRAGCHTEPAERLARPPPRLVRLLLELRRLQTRDGSGGDTVAESVKARKFFFLIFLL